MALDRRKHAGTQSKTNAAWTEKSSVAATTEMKMSMSIWLFFDYALCLPVDFGIWSVAQVGWVEGTVAVGTVEATFMPWAVFADHLFSGEDNKSTSRAARSVSWAGTSDSSGPEMIDRQRQRTNAYFHDLLVRSRFSVSGWQGWGVAVTESFWSEQATVARAAVNFLIRAIAGTHRIQWTMALIAAKAFFVPHGSLGQLLFSSKHGTAATRTTFTLSSFDGCSAGDDEWTVVGVVVFTVDQILRLKSQ